MMRDDHLVLLSAVGGVTRKLREGRGLTRRELAEKSGVSERFLADLETGQGNISLARLHDVARALGTSAGELLVAAQPERQEKRVVALVGLRGAGKSTIGKALAEKLEVPFVELDALVEKDRRLAREVLIRFLAGADEAVIATGGGVVTDREAWRLLQKRCTTVWLQATPEDHWKRVLEQGDVRPGAASPHAQEELRALLKAREPLYAQSALAVDTSRLGIPGAVEEISRRVTSR
ncbi:MAG: helix-turn-helix domain-containing protein [Deltaproteobacteria bacterium]|nr:MAG: helix-turn-helix domain-containing protein [Deltaproteobacteria bacterium]